MARPPAGLTAVTPDIDRLIAGNTEDHQ